MRDVYGKARIIHRIRALERNHEGDCKPVGQGIRELRIHVGPGYRVYFTRFSKGVLVLLCGGTKGTQRRDVQRASRLARKLERD